MSRRYYLSKIKVVEGDIPGQPLTLHRFQEGYPNIDYAGGQIAVGPTGDALHPALLILVASQDHAQFADDPELVAFPSVPPGQTIAATHTPTKLAFRAAVKALGFDAAEVDDITNNSNGWADVLDHFGRKNNPTFDWRKFDLVEQ